MQLVTTAEEGVGKIHLRLRSGLQTDRGAKSAKRGTHAADESCEISKSELESTPRSPTDIAGEVNSCRTGGGKEEGGREDSKSIRPGSSWAGNKSANRASSARTYLSCRQSWLRESCFWLELTPPLRTRTRARLRRRIGRRRSTGNSRILFHLRKRGQQMRRRGATRNLRGRTRPVTSP